MASYLITRSILYRLANNKTAGNSAPQEKKYNLKKKEQYISNKDYVCRACAGSARVSLREQICQTDVISALRSVTNMPISIEDELPQHICTACLKLLESSYKFQLRCRATHYKLQHTVQLAEPVISYPYSKHSFEQILHNMQLKRAKQHEKAEKKIKKKIKKEEKKKKIKKSKRNSILKFKCQPCDISFDTKERLRSHRAARACRRHACHVCGRLVLSLPHHLRVRHGSPRAYTCATCGKNFPILARLNSHQRVHEDTFNFHCAHCPYKCKHKYYLVTHMRTHTGEKPYACGDCGATFVNPSNLNKHRLVHADRMFMCDLCDKSFRTKTALREHDEATHRNVKHSCHTCARHFSYRSDLRKHEIRHHNREKRGYVGIEPTYKQVERRKLLNMTLQTETWRENQDSTVTNDRVQLMTAEPEDRRCDPERRFEQHVTESACEAPALLSNWPDVQPLSLAQLLMQPQRQPYSCLDSYTNTLPADENILRR